MAPSASAGALTAAPTEGLWNLENKDARTGNTVKLKLSVIEDGEQAHDVADVAFPYFGGVQTPNFTANDQGGDVMVRRVPVSHLELAGHEAQGRVMVATVFDLLAGQLRHRPRPAR
jgi:nitrate reductase alpha subunit